LDFSSFDGERKNANEDTSLTWYWWYWWNLICLEIKEEVLAIIDETAKTEAR
jgi:hypothetical protein